MNYSTEIRKLLNKTNEKRFQDTNANILVLNTYPYQNLLITYPGYKAKDNKPDYCVKILDTKHNEVVLISHTEIMDELYSKTTPANYKQMVSYIEELAQNGTDKFTNNTNFPPLDQTGTNLGKYDFTVLTDAIFYIAMQEDINYPEPHLQGRKMCFKRYIEAIYCKTHNNHTLEEAKERAKSQTIPKDWTDVKDDIYSKINSINR